MLRSESMCKCVCADEIEVYVYVGLYIGTKYYTMGLKLENLFTCTSSIFPPIVILHLEFHSTEPENMKN